ncbi:zeatin O-glucosyltransferase-like protein [Tanacetum coccineum]
MRKISSWWNIDYSDVNSYEEWQVWLVSIRIQSKLKGVLEGVYYGLWWYMWNFRNKLLFDKKIPEKALIFDNLPSNSVIYVSFGTTTTFSDEQIKELAIGLERSQQRFIWVARASDKGDVFGDEAKLADLPIGLEEKVGERGLVLRGWAPQVEILGHSATGGFMSHCGWNSSMESISMGVPVATWPMHSDQPQMHFLKTEVLKIGLARWGGDAEEGGKIGGQRVKRSGSAEDGEVRKGEQSHSFPTFAGRDINNVSSVL